MEEATNQAANAATITDSDPEQRTTITEQETPADGEANADTATEATPAPKAKKPAKKTVQKTPEEEQLAAQREQEQDTLAQPLIPAIQGLCWPRSRSSWRYAALAYMC